MFANNTRMKVDGQVKLKTKLTCETAEMEFLLIKKFEFLV